MPNNKCKWVSKIDEEPCSIDPVEGSEYCIFHKPEKTDEEWEEFIAGLKAQIAKNDFDFRGYVFDRDISWRHDLGVTTITKRATFQEAKFQEANFINAAFQEADFWQTTFGEAHFMWATFQEANFVECRFQEANFAGATFQEGSFLGSTFEKADFSEAIFQKGNFGGTTFGKAYFAEAALQKTGFVEATFREADFSEAIFGEANFMRATFQVVAFYRAVLENARMAPLNLQGAATIDFLDAQLGNTYLKKTDLNGHVLQEKEDNYSQAEEVYLLLKNNFHSIGRYDDESWAFKKERDMRRKAYWKRGGVISSIKWLGSTLLNGLYGYGEQPWKPLLWIIGVIPAFALLYWRFDTVCRWGIPKIWACLYFSVVTFSTLGFGDLRPAPGVGWILAGIEAVTGVFFMALFIFTFARRTGGR